MITKVLKKLEYMRGLIKSSSFTLNRSVTTYSEIDIVAEDRLTNQLKLLFSKHGSDKSTGHDYHLFYGRLLKGIPRGSLLEIGIGTNNPRLKSTMGQEGTPGASLFAWRESGLFERVNGADIDKEILFNDEDRIQTHYLDQTDINDLRNLCSNLESQKISVIIDDGLHEVNANVLAFKALWKIVEPGGFYFIEDINRVDLIPLIAELSEYVKTEEWVLYQNYNLKIDNAILCFRKNN